MEFTKRDDYFEYGPFRFGMVYTNEGTFVMIDKIIWAERKHILIPIKFWSVFSNKLKERLVYVRDIKCISRSSPVKSTDNIRTYFFDVCKTKTDNLYLVVKESIYSDCCNNRFSSRMFHIYDGEVEDFEYALEGFEMNFTNKIQSPLCRICGMEMIERDKPVYIVINSDDSGKSFSPVMGEYKYFCLKCKRDFSCCVYQK